MYLGYIFNLDGKLRYLIIPLWMVIKTIFKYQAVSTLEKKTMKINKYEDFSSKLPVECGAQHRLLKKIVA